MLSKCKVKGTDFFEMRKDSTYEPSHLIALIIDYYGKTFVDFKRPWRSLGIKYFCVGEGNLEGPGFNKRQENRCDAVFETKHPGADPNQILPMSARRSTNLLVVRDTPTFVL